ncbi:MAG: Acylphosphate phosphohydrolase, putative [uncultured Microvirga sp.]|uniref:acylphosphatase n=1 Tax=uncultured Microvirga sp. TaxID=412392 RepID=A0A6J4MDU1_9HYPH|nr:MAG: Acylphosphate phosphohydrolase, putative [uncultured Microvirga sp.]
MAERRFVHVTFHGRVQGVGFRAWIEREARVRALDGWVRNRADGTVEAVLAGSAPAVEAILDATRQGPTGARVDHMDIREEEAAGLVPASRPAGFFVLPSV